MFVDTVPNNTSYIAGTFAVNGTTIVGNPNPPGVNIGSIGPGVTETITFKVNVSTGSSSREIINSSDTTYNYIVDPTIPDVRSGISTSNIVKSFIGCSCTNGATGSTGATGNIGLTGITGVTGATGNIGLT